LRSRKSIEACVAEGSGSAGLHLKRSLGVVGLTAFGVGSTVGAGIFSLTGVVAAHQAGPAVALAFVLASVTCFFAGLCYAEFAALVPIAGSAYSYAYVTFGELVAWMVGWSLVLEWLFSASVVAISWSGYVSALLRDAGHALPAPLTASPLAMDAHGQLSWTGAGFDAPAVAVVVVCTLVLLLGMRTSATVNTLIVIAKVAVLATVVAVGARYVQPENWQPFVPPNSGRFGEFGWSGLIRGAGILFFAYLGFDGVSTLAEEARDPQRVLPRSLFATLLICTVLYVGVSLVITGLTDYRKLAVADPLYAALAEVRGPLHLVQSLVSAVAVVGLISVVLTCLIGQIRIFFAMARDGLLPPGLCRLSSARQTPVVASLMTGAAAALIAGLVPLALVGELVSIGTLLAFAVVCAGVLVLRRIAPDAPRPFRTPWVPLIPTLGLLSCCTMMLSLPGDTWIRLLVWLVVGTAVYLAYGRSHSRLRAGSGPHDRAPHSG